MKMKKLVAILMALMMLAIPFAAHALAEETELWYEVSNENTVLTVRLFGNEQIGLDWEFEISNPEALELITMDTEEGMIASFMSTANTANTVSLILRGMIDYEDAPAYTRVLELSINEKNEIEIISQLERDYFADWLHYEDSEYQLVIELPGSGWTFELVDDEVLELITAEETEEGFVASFMATMEKVDMTEIVFTSADGLTQHAVDMFVNESGLIMVEWVETFQILQ